MSFPSNHSSNNNNISGHLSYNNSIIPFPHYPDPNSNSFRFSLVTATGHHHQQTVPAVVGGCTSQASSGTPPTCCPKRSLATTTVRGDRHSKIRTAQGLRDRRVRLSIGIARKFFDLQDLLGFDKASKTLDWLLGQSQTAIHELEKTKNPVQVMEEEEEEAAGQQRRREMARARARERTREKIRNNKLNEEQDEFDPAGAGAGAGAGHHFSRQMDPNKFVTSHDHDHHDLITSSKDQDVDDIVISPNSPLLLSWDLGQNLSFLF